MYRWNDMVTAFSVALEECKNYMTVMQTVYAHRAIEYARKHDAVRMWSCIEKMHGRKHDGTVLAWLKCFEV